jgi:hypothetical protein
MQPTPIRLKQIVEIFESKRSFILRPDKNLQLTFSKTYTT